MVTLKSWMYKVSCVMKVTSVTLCIGLNLVDAYVARAHDIPRETLKLVGCTALFLASKYNEKYPRDVYEYVDVCDDVYTPDQLIDMEAKIFVVLGCNVNIQADVNYIMAIGVSEDKYNEIKGIVTLVLIHGIRFLPSVVVTAVMKVVLPPEEYNNFFGVKEEVVNLCVLEVITICKQAIVSTDFGITHIYKNNEELITYISNIKPSKHIVKACDVYLKNTYFVPELQLNLVDPKVVDVPDAKVLGEGTYGIVKEINYKKMTYAVKTITRVDVDEGVSSSFIREISTTLSLNHNNIIKPRFITSDLLSVFIDLGTSDLRDWMIKLRGGMGISLQLALAEQMFSALKYLHQSGCLHRDIKTKNIIVHEKDGGLRFVLADFGLARGCQIPLKDNAFTHEVVTLWYRPPELLLGSLQYGPAVDVWSMGCVLYEVANNSDLFPGDSEIDQIMKIFRVMGTPTHKSWPGVESLVDYSPNFPQWKPNVNFVRGIHFSPLYKSLIPKCLTMNPDKRPSAVDLYNDLVLPRVRSARR